MFSITSRESFDALPTLFERLLRVKDVNSARNLALILVGNKSDLSEQRQVSAAEASDFANQHDMPYFETSAKVRINVEDAIFELVRIVALSQPLGGARARTNRHFC